MEIVVQTEYQDIFRMKDGVLLIVNKFIPMEIKGVKYPHVIGCDRSPKSRPYDKNCQKELRILSYGYSHNASWCEPAWSVPSGTVVYHNCPVVLASDKSKWKYEIKTTGNCLSGDSETVLELLNNIANLIKGEW